MSANIKKYLHIICFDVPYPPNYGGVIDVYYKIKSLSEAGVRIILHNFIYDRPKAPELNKLCYKVYYYRRRIFKNPFFSQLPYIVNTRLDPVLLQNLLKDNHPILFEGVHSCFYLNHPGIQKRKRIVRMHNIEHIYYKNLARIERNPFKRYFFYTESNRLQKFQHEMKHADKIASISPADQKILDIKYGNSIYIPVFHSNNKVNALTGRGNYVLYHGNLSVGENNKAALYLVSKVFSELKIPLIIAGMNPSKELKSRIGNSRNIKLYNNLSTEKIHQLIADAHINILPTFQSTGIKLKLINVLFRGRFCIVNKDMVKDTGLENLCFIANTPGQMKTRIENLFGREFTEQDIVRRKSGLKEFNNPQNAQKLLEVIYD